MVAKKYQSFVAGARRGGAEIRNGKKHVKVYAGSRLVAVLPHGQNQYEGRHDMFKLRKIWAEQGWDW